MSVSQSRAESIWQCKPVKVTTDEERNLIKRTGTYYSYKQGNDTYYYGCNATNTKTRDPSKKNMGCIFGSLIPINITKNKVVHCSEIGWDTVSDPTMFRDCKENTDERFFETFRDDTYIYGTQGGKMYLDYCKKALPSPPSSATPPPSSTPPPAANSPSPPQEANTKITISGTVKKNGGGVVNGATVKVNDTQSVTTSNDGKFKIENVEKDVNVTISATDCTSTTQKAKNLQNKTVTLTCSAPAANSPSPPQEANTKITISGTVKKNGGGVVSGATVKVNDTQSVTTSNDGKFKIENVKKDVNVTISATDCTSTTQKAKNLQNKTVTLTCSAPAAPAPNQPENVNNNVITKLYYGGGSSQEDFNFDNVFECIQGNDYLTEHVNYGTTDNTFTTDFGFYKCVPGATWTWQKLDLSECENITDMFYIDTSKPDLGYVNVNMYSIPGQVFFSREYRSNPDNNKFCYYTNFSDLSELLTRCTDSGGSIRRDEYSNVFAASGFKYGFLVDGPVPSSDDMARVMCNCPNAKYKSRYECDTSTDVVPTQDECTTSGGTLNDDGTCSCDADVAHLVLKENSLSCDCADGYHRDADTNACVEGAPQTSATTDPIDTNQQSGAPVTPASDPLKEAEDAYKKAKDNEQSLANRTLTAGTTMATGLGMMTAASAKAEQQADEEAEQDMKAYLATFKCEYGRGQSVKSSEEEITLPGGNELVAYYQEYKSLADNLKNTKKALGLRAGIESEVVYDKAESNLYKYSSIGKTDGAFTSLSRALTDSEGEDAAAWNIQKEETAKKVKTGTLAAGGGILGGVAGDAAINTDMIQNIANKFKGSDTESE